MDNQNHKLVADFSNLLTRLKECLPTLGFNSEGNTEAFFIETRELIKKHFGVKHGYNKDYLRIRSIRGSHTYQLQALVPVLEMIIKRAMEDSLEIDRKIEQQIFSDLQAKSNVASKLVFISYSWDNDAHKDWVLNLANALVSNGIDVILDQYELSAGKEMTYFMEKAMAANKVLPILSPNYKLKADKRQGGVGYEYSMLTKEYYDKEPDKTRIIPILRNGDEKTSSPSFMQTRIYHDMREDEKFDAKLFELIKLILDKPLVKKPALGQLPNFDGEEIPDVDKTILEYKKKEKFYQQRRGAIDSVNGAQLFATKADEIIKQITGALENYKRNFGLRLFIKTSNKPPSIAFTTVNFTFHFQAIVKFSNSAREAYVQMSLYKGPVGFSEYGLPYYEDEAHIYTSNYRFDVDENLNPIFIKDDVPEMKLTAHDIATVAVRDLVTHEIKLRESKLE